MESSEKLPDKENKEKKKVTFSMENPVLINPVSINNLHKCKCKKSYENVMDIESIKIGVEIQRLPGFNKKEMVFTLSLPEMSFNCFDALLDRWSAILIDEVNILIFYRFTFSNVRRIEKV